MEVFSSKPFKDNLVFFQRNKFVRKSIGGNRGVGAANILPETEYRNNMSHLMDTEAERNRILAKNGYSHTDWRSDNTTPSNIQKQRTLSAQGQRKEGGW